MAIKIIRSYCVCILFIEIRIQLFSLLIRINHKCYEYFVRLDGKLFLQNNVFNSQYKIRKRKIFALQYFMTDLDLN